MLLCALRVDSHLQVRYSFPTLRTSRRAAMKPGNVGSAAGCNGKALMPYRVNGDSRKWPPPRSVKSARRPGAGRKTFIWGRIEGVTIRPRWASKMGLNRGAHLHLCQAQVAPGTGCVVLVAEERRRRRRLLFATEHGHRLFPMPGAMPSPVDTTQAGALNADRHQRWSLLHLARPGLFRPAVLHRARPPLWARPSVGPSFSCFAGLVG